MPIEYVRPVDEAETKLYRLRCESLKVAAKHPRGRLRTETFDFGNQVAHALEARLAALAGKKEVVVRYPATWWDHLWYDLGKLLVQRARWRWLIRLGEKHMAAAGLIEERYSASLLFTNVQIPSGVEPGDYFDLWELPRIERIAPRPFGGLRRETR